MSADNYIYVGKTPDGQQFGYSMRFSSYDYPPFIDPETDEPKFDTAEDAIKAAHSEVQQHYYEYGVQIDPEVYSEWAAS